MNWEDPGLLHPSDDDLAAYVGQELEGERLKRIELHMARCATCRQEVIDAKEVLRTPRRVPWRALVPVAAAAAILLFLALPPDGSLSPGRPVHRDSPAGIGVAPVPVSPVGSAGEVSGLVWTRAPGADQYRLTLYDTEGLVLWRAMTVDSLLALPDSVTIGTGKVYFWKVEARVGWDVWESSDLVEFQLEGGGPAAPGTGGSG